MKLIDFTREFCKGHRQPKRPEPDVVLGMIERGGRLRFVAVPDATA